MTAVTVTMQAPNQAAGFNVTAASGTNYVSNANGLITANAGDIGSLANAGCMLLPDRPVVTLSTSGYVQQGCINILGSAVSAVTLAVPIAAGLRTTIVMPVASTAASIVTSSGNVLGSSFTVLTFTSALASVDLDAIGSSQYTISGQRATTSSAGAAITYSPASS